MSRVDEAMRRAAEAARRSEDDRSAPVAETPPAIGADPADLMKEAFPIEMPDRRYLRPVTTPAAPAVANPIAPAAPVAADVGPSDPPSLFQRLDARLAGKVIIDQSMSPASREQYRRLAATLHARSAAGFKVLMIASAAVGEGKTLTASNLALTLSESYQREVLLIDADLRRPSLHSVFSVTGSPGLSEGLMAAEEQKLTLHQATGRLTILPAGMPNADPMAVLTSPRMQHLIDEARGAFDWVIIDTPPVGLLTDASLLSAMVDGVLLVVEAGATHYDLVRRAVETIGPSRIVGVVLNRATTQSHGYGAGYDYYAHYHTVAGTDLSSQ